MKIKYVGFDKDGTLIDDFDDYAKEWGRLINEEYGINAKEATEVFIKMAGEPTVTQLATVFQKNNKIFSQTYIFKKAEEIAYRIGKNVSGNLFPEVIQVLQQLKKNNYFIFVSSGQREEIVEKDLERTNILQFIDFYAGIRPDQPDFKKGEPHFRAAAMHFGIPFETFTKQTVFIGDTPTDVEVSNNSNIVSIVRKSSNADESLLKNGAKYVVDDFTSLPEIIKEI